jgi:hypothetical protein
MTTRKTALTAPASTQSSDSSLEVASDSPHAEMRPLDPPKTINRNESSDNYSDFVAVLNPKRRVIRCRDGIQWILQCANRAETVARDGWRGRSYCRTKKALIRVCDAHAGLIDPDGRAILAGLPEWFPEKKNAPGQTSESVSPIGALQVDSIEEHPSSSSEASRR